VPNYKSVFNYSVLNCKCLIFVCRYTSYDVTDDVVLQLKLKALVLDIIHNIGYLPPFSYFCCYFYYPPPPPLVPFPHKHLLNLCIFQSRCSRAVTAKSQCGSN
jgi:hypothetical protein